MRNAAVGVEQIALSAALLPRRILWIRSVADAIVTLREV